MALRREVVDFVRLHILNNADEVRGIGQIAVVQDKPPIRLMRILIQVVNPLGVEGGRPAFAAMHDIALVQQKLACALSVRRQGPAKMKLKVAANNTSNINNQIAWQEETRTVLGRHPEARAQIRGCLAVGKVAVETT